MKFFGVLHLFGQDSKHKSFLVLFDFLLVQFLEVEAKRILLSKGLGYRVILLSGLIPIKFFGWDGSDADWGGVDTFFLGGRVPCF